MENLKLALRLRLARAVAAAINGGPSAWSEPEPTDRPPNTAWQYRGAHK
jgi:hypothetical protein